VIILVKNVKDIIREEEADGPKYGVFHFWISKNYNFSILCYIPVFSV